MDDFTARVETALRGHLARARERCRALVQRYGLREWPRALERRRAAAAAAEARLQAALVERLTARRTRLLGYGDRLRALSPRLVLERGYCLARRPDGTLVRSAERLALGELLALEFARGEADARIEGLRPGGRNGG